MTSFKKYAFWNIVLSLGSSILPLGLIPLFTRLYTPQSYGAMSLFTGLVAFYSACGNFGLETVLLSAKYPYKELQVVKHTMTIVGLLIFPPFTIISFLYYSNIFKDLSITQLLLLSFASSFIGLFSCNRELANFWNLRLKLPYRNSLATLSSTNLNSFLKVILGLLNTQFAGLIVSSFISSLVELFLLRKSIFVSQSIRNKFRSHPLIKNIKDVFTLHRKTIYNVLPSSIFDVFFENIIFVFIAFE